MFARSSLRGAAVVLCLSVFFLALTVTASARTPNTIVRPSRGGERIVGGSPGAAKAAVDSVLVMGPIGSGAPYLGGFQDAGGAPAWNGWTSVDYTVRPNHWHADTYRVLTGTYSAWCGADIASCGANDPAGGYGNNYDDTLEWRGAVADPGQPCTVTISALANYDTEPGWDYVHLIVATAGGEVELWTADGKADAVAVGGSHDYQPGDYVGAAADEVSVLFRVTSDGGFSDADCSWPSAGAMQLDDVVISLDNGDGVSWGFEDGTLGPFTLTPVPYVGDFARIWTGLEDYDPCRTNDSPQVAFIDDGVVVPGTGGTPCVNWCYGPGGWIVSTEGGLAGPDYHLHNGVESPVMDWPAFHDAARLEFTVYEHEDLSYDAPGIFWIWGIRSAAAGDGIADHGWQDRNWVYYGGPGYERQSFDVGDLMVAGAVQVQVRLGVNELGWVWGWNGYDGYPAPYFDDVRLVAARQVGPVMSTDERYLAQDGFPASGVFDPFDRGAASVRFDMAANVAPAAAAAVIPGDSVVIDVVLERNGPVLTGRPRMYYRLKANPQFNEFRTSGLPTSGYVACDTVKNASGIEIQDRWYADLPDTGFFFPGDVLHYYFRAEHALGGLVETAILPADTTGFSDFGSLWTFDPQPYDPRFTVRALPTQVGNWYEPAKSGSNLLVWFDSDSMEDWDTWRRMLYDVCLFAGYNVDVYTTRAASSHCGNGLGARCTLDILAGYQQIAYTAGGLDDAVLGDGGDVERSPDLQLLEAWLALGARGFYAGGDGVASSLLESTEGSAFLSDRLGVRFVASDVRPLIDNQFAPRVIAAPSTAVAALVPSWVAAGGCPKVRRFDAVEPLAGTTRIAEFASPGAQTGYYTYAAMARRTSGTDASTCVFTPYDPARVADAVDPGPNLPANARVLGGILETIGNSRWSTACYSDVPTTKPVARLEVDTYPNPFNPRVRIDYTIAHAGRLTVKIFDLRGRLVRVVMDEQVAAAGSVDWDGNDARGAAAASGVYFYEVRMDNEVEVGKLALIR